MSCLQWITFRGRCSSELQQKDLSSDSGGSVGRITLKGHAEMQQQLQVPDPPGCREPGGICAIGLVQFKQNWSRFALKTQKFFAV